MDRITDRCTLVADTRERAVFGSFEKGAEPEIHQMTVGDYAILSPAGAIMAIIERKSLADFAASFIDGRHGNKAKLVELRERTGCKIVYVIEGNEEGAIPWSNIESSMFHLMLREGICVLRTTGVDDTAATLTRFTASAGTLIGRPDYEEQVPVDDNPLGLLTAKRPPSTGAESLWGVFKGIGAVSALALAGLFSISQVVLNEITVNEILAEMSKNGVRLPPRAHVEAFFTRTLETEIKLLTAINGISKAMAVQLLSPAEGTVSRTIKDLLEDGDLMNRQIRTGRLGKAKADKIIHALTSKRSHAAQI